MQRHFYILAVLLMFSFSFQVGTPWLKTGGKGYTVYYRHSDQNNVKTYDAFFANAIVSVRTFFGLQFPKPFDIYVHESRASLDSAWQKDWGVPDFKSECWMVASGVHNKMDLISPATWSTTACEHNYNETAKTQQLITHEMVHVLHGQKNVSPDFSDVEAIDWFVEGLATYASGQCDSARIAQVKKAITENKVPASLDAFWTGKLKYGLAGSVVMFIDRYYGRKKLIELLAINKKTKLLNDLGVSEQELLNRWREFIAKL